MPERAAAAPRRVSPHPSARLARPPAEHDEVAGPSRPRASRKSTASQRRQSTRTPAVPVTTNGDAAAGAAYESDGDGLRARGTARRGRKSGVAAAEELGVSAGRTPRATTARKGQAAVA